MDHDKARKAGSIRGGEVYSLPEFMKRTGMGVAAMRSARRRGLKVHRNGKRSWIFGADFIAFIEQQGRLVR